MPLNIKELRAKSGFTQAELAERLEVTRQTIINWEKGQSRPDGDELRRLALAFEVDVSEIKVAEVSAGPPPIPLYDGVISAGYGLEVNEDPVTGPTDMIYPGTWVKGANAAMRVHGDSMFPEYRPGSMVALRMIHDYPTEIIWGEVHVVETQENRLIRAIHQSEKGDDFFDMICLNPGVDNKGRTKYPVKTYPWKKIRRIFKVLATFDYKSGAGGVFIIKEREAENVISL